MTLSVQRADPLPLLNLNKARALGIHTSSQIHLFTGSPGLPGRHTVHWALLAVTLRKKSWGSGRTPALVTNCPDSEQEQDA